MNSSYFLGLGCTQKHLQGCLNDCFIMVVAQQVFVFIANLVWTYYPMWARQPKPALQSYVDIKHQQMSISVFATLKKIELAKGSLGIHRPQHDFSKFKCIKKKSQTQSWVSKLYGFRKLWAPRLWSEDVPWEVLSDEQFFGNRSSGAWFTGKAEIQPDFNTLRRRAVKSPI